jgi:hypothetical protein
LKTPPLVGPLLLELNTLSIPKLGVLIEPDYI